MPLQNVVRLLSARRPDGNAPVGTGRHHPPILEESYCVHSARMKTKDLLGGFGCERPTNRGGIEATRQNRRAVGRDRNCAHRTAVPHQLRPSRRQHQY
jgi:hypothetical protein